MNNNLLYFTDFQLIRIHIAFFIMFANVQINPTAKGKGKEKVMNSYEQATRGQGTGVRGQEIIINN